MNRWRINERGENFPRVQRLIFDFEGAPAVSDLSCGKAALRYLR
jgi:hypothetical protein